MSVMELRFDSSSAFVPRMISDFIAEVSAIGDFSLRLSKLQGFVAKLEEEKRKIDAFKRELPISVLLVNEAIERLKEKARAIEKGSESMIRETRAIEEFMPLKKKSASFDEEDEDEDDEDEEDEIGRANSESDDFSDKRNWMSSAQLWSSNVDFDLKPGREKEEDDKDKQGIVVEGQCRKYGHSGGAFVPFKASSGSSSSQTQRLTSLSLTIPQISELGCVSSSLTTTTNSNSYSNSKTSYGNNNNNNNKNDNSASFRGVSRSSSAFLMEQVKLLPNKPQTQTQNQTQTHHQSFRKQRRCWSPELHRRFVDALQQLGGSQATPKQIRELMQVEGLTNDEVKSHLQKYRLHVRKLPNSQATQGNGDLWMTQQDHSGDNSKANMDISESGSPQGPLLANGSHKALSNTGGDSTEGDEDDEKSDGHSWRGHGGNNNHQNSKVSLEKN